MQRQIVPAQCEIYLEHKSKSADSFSKRFPTSFARKLARILLRTASLNKQDNFRFCELLISFKLKYFLQDSLSRD
jgi:hypothetical protein